VQQVRELFLEYESSLGISLCFQNFQTELATLPGEYAPPEGCLSIARYDGEVAGCVAMRKLSDGICEMKRLYVRLQYQGMKIGRSLTEHLIEHARHMGYSQMRLDTLPSMDKALSLYRSCGFTEIAPYRDYPIRAIFMELPLI
jgi:ribosomal protein S18 acetylase RimI-like enzyme